MILCLAGVIKAVGIGAERGVKIARQRPSNFSRAQILHG